MKGLLLKDLIHLKKQSRVLSILFVFYLILSLSSGDSAIFGGIVSIMMVMLTITTMAYDEQAKWDMYALTMPVSRSDLVIGKYLLGFALSFFALILNLAFLMIAGPVDGSEVIVMSLMLFGISLFLLFVILPILFSLGVEKGRLVMMMVLLIPAAAILILSRLGLPVPDPGFFHVMAYIAPLFLIALGFLSVVLSLRIVKRKEY